MWVEFVTDFADVNLYTHRPASSRYILLAKWGFKMNEEG